MRRFRRISSVFHRTLLSVVEHDCFNVAQSAAYSAMISLFPALIIAAAFIGFLPDMAPLRFQLAQFFNSILPSDVTPILESYFATTHHSPKSVQAIIIGILVSVTGASSVIATFMEGFRRAHNLPDDCWTFWQRRIRAFALVPLSLIPLAIASLLIVFGHFIVATWMAMHIMPSIRTPVYVMALIIRWVIAFASSIGIIALIYHMGTPMRQSWKRTIPGAVLATAMWFLTTLAFGWYVTRFANYSQVYGSLGAGIALLFWLYIISLSVLCGAEFNAQCNTHFFPSVPTHSTLSSAQTPPTG
ncbi:MULTISPECIES: YihY/virulence factor BrkB family protein [Acidobacteriaceae]|uniref:YihY/virulence factor BrkB family protein n=1 Tax=Acidobacteriaceae TaxID=204434 RepID=UPI00131DC857|nr:MULTISPECIES: YihY/virulence factor BrkB family protein [Acidobacteriaceae]MDW5264268.1 YihY/virulence factor BrkB family protein [Edaphobacter sp.]